MILRKHMTKMLPYPSNDSLLFSVKLVRRSQPQSVKLMTTDFLGI